VDLFDLLRRNEDKTLEFKRDLSSPDGALRTIVAFANTAGGVLLIGIDDRTRSVRGVKQALDVEARLVNLISDSILPRLVPDVEILAFRSSQVVAVEVHPSPSRPHHLVGDGREQGIYVRVGASNRRADRELAEEMRRAAHGEAYDEQAMPGVDSEAIDFRAASESFAGIRKLSRRDLRTLRLIVRHQGRDVATVGGILLFGKERERHFPDAWIQAGRFRGTDKSEIIDTAGIHEHPAAALKAAIAFVERNTTKSIEIGKLRHVEHSLLPPLAVREALVNAMVHADYAQRGAPIRLSIFDDRMEVENPGLLPFGLTVDDLYRGVSKLRNRVIGRVFYELGLIEQWGSGIQRMTRACREAGLDEPLLEELGHRFRVTIRTTATRKPEIDTTDQVILDALRHESKGLGTQDVARAIGLSVRTARTRLLRLIGLGLVHEVGTSPEDPRRRYFPSQRRR
jgi:predicted HTH transcriptional regulator